MTTRVSPTEPTIRAARTSDGDAIAEIHMAACQAAPMPASIHPAPAIRTWVDSLLSSPSKREFWVATSEASGKDDPGKHEGEIMGYLRLLTPPTAGTPGWLEDLYILPGSQGRGIGSSLMEKAKSRRPDGLQLWVFASNQPAREFYRKKGFVEVEETDGRGNEEGEPDVRMVWLPAQESGTR